MDDGIADMVENNSDELYNECHLVAPEVQHAEEIDMNEQSDNQGIYHGCFYPKEVGHEYYLGIDLGITRKQVSCETLVNCMNRTDFMCLTRNLNEKQKVFFYHVLNKIKNDDFPFYCFLTGGAGVGKSVLITALYQAITRYYTKSLADCPDDIKAVLCAPTEKAAHNIGGHTIHSLFCIPANQNLKFKPLDVHQLDTFRVKFRSLKVVFIDEISMVGNKMFNFINLRLQEIFATEQPFGAVSIIISFS